jgi:hypothetical protein
MKKRDIELMKKIKEEIKENKPIQLEVIADSDTVAFDIWWSRIAKEMNMPHYLKEIIAADFKARGLSKEEKVERFNEALAAFGY